MEISDNRKWICGRKQGTTCHYNDTCRHNGSHSPDEYCLSLCDHYQVCRVVIEEADNGNE
jgi:hypothetical protein